MAQAGDTLGQYKLVRSLGKGGYAEVFLAEHTAISTLKVAVKVLHSTHLTGSDVARFEKEAHTIAGLSHPNIIRLLNYGVEGNIPYLVMDYAPNGTLRQRHPDGTQLPLPIILPYVKQVAAALQYVHDKGLVHRDIKPQNMLISANDEVLLSDFGIVAVVHSQYSQHLRTQSIVGTPEYIAPEQLNGNYQKASDQYSLAVVVYEWLCGERPFDGVYQQIHLHPEPLRTKVPNIPPQLEQVVFTALDKDPARRYPSVQMFAEELERAASSRGGVRFNGGGQGHAVPDPHGQTTVKVSPPTPATRPQRKPPGLFAFVSHNLLRFNRREGRYLLLGGIGDAISSIVLGLAYSNYWAWLMSLIFSLLLRFWCAGLVRKPVAWLLAFLLALYRGWVGWSFEAAINSATHFAWLPPPGILAVIFFIVSIILNVRFVNGKQQ